MRRTILLAIAAGAILVAACTPGVTVQNEAPAPGAVPSGINVSGTGEVYGTPDTLDMAFGVGVVRPTVERAVDDAAALADQLISTLKANGVATEDIQTANYSIYPQYDYSGEKARITGYEVDNTVTAKIRDVADAGDVIDAVAANGSDEVQISGVSFSIEDDAELIAAARAAAWADAEAKAQQLADLAGVSLGRAMTITESFGVNEPVPVYRSLDEMPMAEAGAPTPIEPGRQQVTVSLQVRFATTP